MPRVFDRLTRASSGDLLSASSFEGLSVLGRSSLSNEAERLEQDRLLSWLKLLDRVESKLDSPDECSISAKRIRFFFGGSFSVGKFERVSLLCGQWNFSAGSLPCASCSWSGSSVTKISGTWMLCCRTSLDGCSDVQSADDDLDSSQVAALDIPGLGCGWQVGWLQASSFSLVNSESCAVSRRASFSCTETGEHLSTDSECSNELGLLNEFVCWITDTPLLVLLSSRSWDGEGNGLV